MIARGVSAALVLAGTLAHAQPPVFEKKGDTKDVKDIQKVVWSAKGEAGLVASTGNSRTTTLTASANALRKDLDNKLELTLLGTYARATTLTAVDANGDGFIDATELGETTATAAENISLKLRYDRYLTPVNALYVAALAAIDKPAGKDFQGGAQIGYSRGLYKDRCQELLGEVGYDFTYINVAAGASVTIHSARLFVGHKAKIRSATTFEGSIEALLNGTHVTYGMREAGALEATRLNATAGIVTALSTKLSLNASFTAKYEAFPAPLAKIGGVPFAAGFEPPAEKLDTLTKISLIFQFL